MKLKSLGTLKAADGQDLSFVVVEALDDQGQLQPNADHEIEFTIDGPGVIVAAGNGNGKSDEMYVGSRRRLFNGRALVVIRSALKTGAITLKANSSEMTKASVTIRTKQGARNQPL